MSEKLDKNSTNKINLLTLKEAATLASYSTAYLARLIKQNKIEGKQVDRQWYIDSNSLNIFLEDVAKAKKIQREKIRQERIAERNVIPLVVSDEVVRDELPKSEDISPFNLPALVGSVATVATFAFFFILGSGVHSYDYLAILDVSESLGDMSFLPEEDSTLKALAISSDGQTLLTSIKEHLWCGIEVVFLNDGRCLYLPVFEYAIAEPRKKTDQVTTTATSTVAAVENVNSGSGTTIINEYITNNPVVEVKETVIENRLVERFSTKENVTRQADELINSINELSISFETDLLTVNGELNAASTTIGGTLEASGFIASNRFVRAPYFVATDATATSTFAGALAVGTTTSNATLTVDGATYLASITAPASTSSLLYNLGGELYWAGSAIAGPSVGTWGTDGINVWRGSGNVGIGTTTPSQSLSVVGSGLITGGFGIGVATNTPGVLQTSGDALIGGNLTVMGNSTVFGNSTTIGTTTGGTLVINSRIASDLIPQINGTYNLGSPSLYWNDAYVDTLTVNNISAASTSIAGTQSETFTFNSDNASSDNEDINLIFYRGSVVPNALITWDSTADRFDINQPFFIQNDSSSTTIPTLQLAGSASQTSDIFKVNSFAGSSLFNITSAGRVGIGTTTPASKLDIWGNLQVGTSSASTLIVNTATGQVGINTSSPTSGYSLDVAGLAYASGGFYSNNFSSSWDGSASNPNFRRASDTNTGIFFPGADNIAITTGGTERFRIDSSGNVGIGTTSPASIFHVESAFPMVTLHDTSGVSGARFTTNGVSNPASPAFRFGVDAMASTLMTMLKNGNVGIGTTTPGRKLELYQTGSSNALMRLTSVPSSPGTSNESAMEFYTAATNNTTPLLSGRITSNFTGTSYTNTVLKFQNATTGGVLLDTMTLANGNVGIGTTNPGTMLHVTGTIQSGSPDSVAGTLIANGNGSGSSSGGSIWLRTATDHDTVIDRFQIAADANNFYVGTEDQSDLFAYNGTNNSWYFNHNGNVGIGITNPQNILQIQKDSTYSSESSAGLSVRSATADTELLLGTDAVNDIGYIQAMQDGTSWTTRALVLQPNGGKVGIGTTTPTTNLSVSGSTGIQTDFGGVVVEVIGRGDLGYGIVGTDTNHPLHLRTNNATRMVLDTSGNVGIGTTSPVAKFDIRPVAYSNNQANGILLGNTENNLWNSSIYLRSNESGSARLSISGPGVTDSLVINSSGNVGIGTTTPTEKLHILGSESNGSTATLRISSGLSSMLLDNNEIDTISSSLFLNSNVNGNVILATGGGNVGIGTTSPVSMLSVAGTGIFSGSAATPLVLERNSALSNVSIEFRNQTQSWYAGQGRVGAGNFSIGTSNDIGASGFLNITPAGNVGIGTTTPSEKLSINAGSISLFDAGGRAIELRHINNYGVRMFLDGATADLRFQTNNLGTYADALTIKRSNGYVGIGTSTPTYPLDIYTSTDGTISTRFTNASNGNSARTRFTLTNDAGNSGFINLNGSNFSSDPNTLTVAAPSVPGGHLILSAGGSELMRLAVGGNVGIGTMAPERLFEVSGLNDSGGITAQIKNQSLVDGTYAELKLQSSSATNSYTGGTIRNYRGTNGRLAFSSSGSSSYDEKMSILTNGNVGVGTTTPAAKLSVYGTVSGRNYFTELNSQGYFIGGVNTFSAGMLTNGSGDLNLRAGGGGERLTILASSGNVGIGTTSPAYKLDVAGDIGRSGGDIVMYAGIKDVSDFWFRSGVAGNYTDELVIDTSANSVNIGANSLYVPSGNIGIGTTTPTEKLSILSADNSASTNIFAIRANNQGRGIGFGYNNIRLIGSTANQPLSIDAAGSGDILLQTTATGNVGIGTTSPSARTEIELNSSTDILRLTRTGQGSAAFQIGGTGYPLSLYTTLNKDIQFTPGGTNVMRLTASGNVGIGTTSPSHKLSIATSQDNGLLLYDTTNNRSNYITNSSVGLTFNSAAQSFVTGGSERMRIMANGNVGIGTTSPQSKLVVVQSNQTSTGGITIRKSNADAAWGQYINTDSSFNLAYGSESSLASTYLTVQTGTGNVGIGTTTPSNKLTVQGNAHITGALYDNNNSAGSNGMVLQSTGSGFNWVATSSLGISGGGGGGLAATDIDTCSELAAIISGETGTCGSLVLSASPTFTGTVNAAAATLSSTLTMSGSAANIALGSNFLSGDGGDEGISINTNGDFTFTGASGDSLFINLNEGSGYPTFFSSANTISLSANTEILDGFELSLSDEGNDRSAYLLVENNGATVFGNSAGDIALMPTGNVGIGTSTPGARLEIAGSASVSATVPAIRLSDTAGNPNSRNWEISNARGPYGSLAFLQSSTVGGVPTSANTRLLIDHNGNVGIGTTTPGEKLHVNGPTFIGPTVSSSPAGTLSTYGVYLSNAGYISMNRNNGTALYAGRSNDGTLVSFHSAGISQGSISVSGATLSYNAFTGSHYAHLDGVEAPEPGTVMSMTSNNVYQGNDPMISAEPIYGVVPSSIENDDRILGTYLSLTDPTKPYSNNIGEDYNPYLVSAVGNGFMWVVDSGEDIEVGDWLITASTTGHAKKDPKTHSVSHVIAKASESVVWDNITSTTVDGVKHVKIQVLFENFDRPNSIVLDGPVDNTTSSHTLLSFNDTTIWSRLAKLAASFVDGVLTLTKASIEYIRADFLEVRDGRFSEQLCVGDVCVDEDTFLALVGGASATSSDLTTSEGILCLGNTCIDEDGLRELMRENNVNVIDPNTLENQEDEEQQTGTSTNPVDNTTANGTTGTSSLPVINDSGIASSTATSTNDGTGTTATSTNNGTGGVTLDTTAPTVTLNGSGSLTLTVGDSYTEEGATATDDTDGDITSGIVISGTVDTSTAGTYMITYEVEDQAGNMAETTRTITVEEAPASNPETPPTEPVVVDPIPTP